jgi:phosphatidylinositol alpha-mannosyltransferase
MKIALVSQEYFPETARGGIGTQTYMKARGLAKLGHEIFIISRSVNDKRLEYNNLNISEICIPGMENTIPEMTEIVQWLTHSVVVAAEIEVLHQRVGLDIIDFPEWAAEGYVYLLNRSAWKNIPTVIQLHGPLVMFANTMCWPDKDSSFYRIGTNMEAACIQLADGVYSSSEYSKQWVLSNYNAHIENIPIIHTGIDTEKFSPRPNMKDGRPTLIFVGKIVRNKGVEELVEAACNLVKVFPNLLLRLIGRGEESLINKLKSKADKCAPGLIEICGFVKKDSLPEEISKADIFVAPSWFEGGPGFVYLEAMACGLPVIGCSGSGIEEIIVSGKNGILIPPKNTQALENALVELLSDRIFLNNMGIQAREYVIKEANSNECLKKIEAFYYSVLESKYK